MARTADLRDKGFSAEHQVGLFAARTRLRVLKPLLAAAAFRLKAVATGTGYDFRLTRR